MNTRTLQAGAATFIWMFFCIVTCANAEPVKRSILVPYNGAQIKNISDTLAHRMAEMPLNFLGLKVVYWDLQQGLPEPAAMQDIRGIFVWLDDDRLADPEGFVAWLMSAATAGVRLTLFGNPALYKDYRDKQVPLPLANSLLALLGLQSEGSYTGLDHKVSIDKKNIFLSDFEYPALGMIAGFERYTAIDVAVSPHLSLKVAGTTIISHVVATGQRGGFVESGFAHAAVQAGAALKWRINPFVFFQLAFATEDIPKPDPATVSNRRVTFSYIVGTEATAAPLPENFSKTSSFWRAVNELAGSNPATSMAIIVGSKNKSVSDKDFAALTQYFAKFPQVELYNAKNMRYPVAINFGRSLSQAPFSYTTLPPLALSAANERQIYLPANEDVRLGIISHLLVRNYFARSETPYRLRPLSIYYAYSNKDGSAQLNALKKYFEKTRFENGVSVSFNLYAQMVEDFYNVRLNQTEPRRWEIDSLGELRTIRFDRAAHLTVDFERSRGVIGQRQHQGSLYIALDKEETQPIVELSDITTQHGSPVSPLYLIQSSWLVERLIRESDSAARFTARGLGQGEFLWQVPTVGTYQVVAKNGGQVIWQERVEIDDKRQLRFIVKSLNHQDLDIHLYPETSAQSQLSANYVH